MELRGPGLPGARQEGLGAWTLRYEEAGVSDPCPGPKLPVCIFAGGTQYAWEITVCTKRMSRSKKRLWLNPSHTPATTAAAITTITT